ncbi:MAG TPA: GTP cyclohydrolase I FolE [Myxococcota bacterium]|nr:GTP cyclohydrolase I FolE [Myxococcota bacterium]HOC99174.1 GTP cyclohydrolase I FolE [Myxococcota bacterium]HOH77235.1 GTP cyclohydrolase I FolE [Myxococcota bacterium]HPV05118.1 GTP cyclohydrolase I FolE [Myxococcota bacterium]
MNEKDFEGFMNGFIAELGDDPSRPGLERTPARVWESMHYLTRGYREDLNELMAGATFADPSRDLVMVRDIAFNSICEHHVLPFFGTVTVGYIPNGSLIGLSKIARVVDHFACRLQVQERMTAQIADTLVDVLNPRALAVTVTAKHLCMAVRGVSKQDSNAVTFAWRGQWSDDEAGRGEFLAGIGLR